MLPVLFGVHQSPFKNSLMRHTFCSLPKELCLIMPFKGWNILSFNGKMDNQNALNAPDAKHAKLQLAKELSAPVQAK